MIEDVAVVVMSCDAYSVIWPPFYNFFFKYWSDCPFTIYNGSNHLSFAHPRVVSLHSDTDSDWSSVRKAILKQVKEKYVILLLEDYFLNGRPDMELLRKSINCIKKQDGLFLMLSCFPVSHKSLWEYDKLDDNPLIGKIRSNQEYRINTQISIWNKELLCDLLKDGESIWEFEINGSKRSNEIPNPCLCIIPDPNKNYVHGPIPYLCTAITKGIWMLDAIELGKKEGITIDTSHRKVETKFQYWFRRLYTRTPLSKRKYLDFIRSRVLKFQY
jgi:hypothetical protein